MTSSPSRGEEDRERKTVCTHSSMSVSNYCPTNHWQGSIGSIWDGVVVGGRGLRQRWQGHAVGKGESEDAARQKNNWSIRQDGFCHFEKGCQGYSLPPAQSSKWHTRPSRHSSAHPFFFTTGISEGISNVNQECLGLASFELQGSTPSPMKGPVAAWREGCTYLGDELNR